MHHNYVNGDMAVFAVYCKFATATAPPKAKARPPSYHPPAPHPAQTDLDNGASFWWVHDNVCTASPAAWAYFMTGGANLPAKNNRMELLWYTKANVLGPNNQCAQWNCTVDQATIYAVDGPWPPAAQAIIDGSGA